MKKFYIILVLSAIIFFGAGFFIANNIGKCPVCPASQVEAKKDANDTYAAGWAAAKKRLQETGNYFIDTTFPIKEVFGTIKNIGNNKLIITIKPLEPLADQSLDERIIVIDSSTSLSEQIKKADADFAKEIAEYNKKYKELQGPIIQEPYPNQLTEKTISFGDFKTDQEVKVETDIDARNLKEFNAKKISILFSGNL